MKPRHLFLLSTLAFLTPAYALTGAETTNPDTIVLKEALLIQNGVQYGRQNFVFDPQAKDMISGHAARPTDGKVSGKTQNGRYARWEKFKAGEKDYFRTDKLRGGALYIEYSSEKEKVMILEASGHTMALVNGEPREGDHYDFNFSGHPFVMKKGINTFYLTNGRFNRIRAYITEPYSEVMIKKKDLTIPDLVIEEKVPKWGSMTLINASKKKQEDLIITCKVKNEKISTAVPALNKLCSKRVNFKIPYLINPEEGDEQVEVTLTSPGKKVLDTYIFKIKVKPFKNNHDRTFISRIDGSVQYYSVTPGTDAGKVDQALFLSVHGAGVQARNQAWTYDAKDWGHIVAPTNRRPFGFAWDLLLEGSPVRAENGSLKIGKKTLKGKDIACYFIRPRPGTHDNCVGVVSGTGLEGMHAAYPNQYFIAGTSFPDLSVFRMPESENDYESLVCAGFFGNDWSIENGDFSWNGK